MGLISRVRVDTEMGKPALDPIFLGTVSIQTIVTDELADLLRVTAVTFENGARNRPHRHSTDQVLIATSGSGFVATNDVTLSLESGDLAFIPKCTRHWHGAIQGRSFSHLSVLTPGHMEIDDEPAE